LGLAVSLILLPVIAAAADSPLSYDRDIQPILSDRCFQCHGPDAESREAELRLDTRDGLMEYVVVPNHPEESELVRRIMSDDESERMPPPESKLSLTEAQKALLQRWIAEGAEFSEHWSFRPLPEHIDEPAVENEMWPRRSIDRFILARLEAEGIEPSGEAEPLRLLRRMTLDITGLPPTVEEIREFEAAAAEDLNAALEQAADRLLESPAYGEHLAIYWLDAIRYADSYGYQSDQLHTQWPYRDWVVRAFNQNLPYDQFLTWQLAGDLLESPSRDQILATAVNRMHRMTNEGGSLAEEWLVENAADRIQTMSTAVLGLTLECARCHDHKFDPISMRDYYSFSAFFNSIDESGLYDRANKVPSPSMLLPTDEQTARLDAVQQKIADTESALATAVSTGEPRFRDWLTHAPSGGRGIDLIGYFTFDGDGKEVRNEAPGKTIEGIATGVDRVAGLRGKAVRFDGDHGVAFPKLLEIDRWDNFSVDFWMRDAARSRLPVVVLQRSFGTDTGYNGFDLMLEDGYLEARFYRVWPGNGIGVRSLEPIAKDQWQHVAVTYDGSSTARGFKLYLAGKELPTTILRDGIHKSASVRAHGEGHFTLGERFRERGFRDGEIDELRVFDRALTPIEVHNLDDGEALAAALADHESNLVALRQFYFSAIDADTRRLREELRELRQEYVAEEDELQEVSIMRERPEPRPTYILTRGAYDAPKTDENRVERDTFESILLPFPKDAPRDRLGLAHWITDPRHPLTSRVFVNHIWRRFFGQGLVATPENFGRQGAMPTHPELLDWLARDFVDHGWDIKRLCRQIVLSTTYRQDSRLRPDLVDVDPENHLLARGPSRRLSAEQIRDVALAASGQLVRRMGGPPVSPYQPGGDLWREANEMSPPYKQSTGKELYRRSLYSVWKRTSPLPNMTAFDAPTREVCVVNRSRTNTPLQALVLLNDVQFVEAARALATLVAKNHAEVDDRIREAFLRFTGRFPDPIEMELLTKVYNEQRTMFTENAEQDALKFIGVGDSKPDLTLPPADLAALTATCQVILNLDATIYER
jgi:hypothetical protein